MEAGGGTAMRVGIDGYNLAIPRGTGVATYARSLSHCLHALGHTVDVLYGMPIAPETAPAMRTVAFLDMLQNERHGKAPKYPSLAWARLMLRAYRGAHPFEIPVAGALPRGDINQQLPAFDRVLNVASLFQTAQRYFHNFGRLMQVRMPDPPAIMHWTYPVPVTLQGARNIYTIHDLVPLRLPYTTLDNKPVHMRLLTECLRTGDHICTVSDTSRADILQFFPHLDPERVTNTYQAVIPPRTLPSDDEMHRLVRGAFDLEPGRYFLFFGSIEPKKNIGRLLEAYLSTSLDLPLVLIGARAWKADQELALLQHRPPGDRRVRQIDYVTQRTLATLIRSARAVVFPSLYEGFGLPVLEAMALGTPVLTSREGSLPEVAGDAALFVDAYDPSDIARGLERLASDTALCADLSARGRDRARAFDMTAYQARLAAMYDRVLAYRRP
jgi:glycosyltransferase involved in cell wall biosynthesis